MGLRMLPSASLHPQNVIVWMSVCRLPNKQVMAYLCLQLSEVYSEIYRVLKPGAIFASYEWVSTAEYNGSNKDHVRIIDEINFGNGLPVSVSCFGVELWSGASERVARSGSRFLNYLMISFLREGKGG